MYQYKIESFDDLKVFLDAMNDVVSQIPIPEGFAFVLNLEDSVIDEISREILESDDNTQRVSMINYEDRFCVYLVAFSGE